MKTIIALALLLTSATVASAQYGSNSFSPGLYGTGRTLQTTTFSPTRRRAGHLFKAIIRRIRMVLRRTITARGEM
jgi:hypothetical protein